MTFFLLISSSCCISGSDVCLNTVNNSKKEINIAFYNFIGKQGTIQIINSFHIKLEKKEKEF